MSSCYPTPMPPPISISACNTCSTCCSTTVGKRTVEKSVVCLPWHHRLTCGGVWTLRKVVHSIKMPTGASLATKPYDSATSYAAGDVVQHGGRVFTAAAPTAGIAPLPANAMWTDTGASADLFIALDTDSLAMEWIDKQQVATFVTVQGGESDTDYRVEAMATFRDCDGHEIELWDCALVKVLDCSR